MKTKLTREQDGRLFKNRIRKFFGTYQYVDTSLPEHIMRDQSVEDNRLALSILYAIVLVFSLMVSAVAFGIWLMR